MDTSYQGMSISICKGQISLQRTSEFGPKVELLILRFRTKSHMREKLETLKEERGNTNRNERIHEKILIHVVRGTVMTIIRVITTMVAMHAIIVVNTIITNKHVGINNL